MLKITKKHLKMNNSKIILRKKMQEIRNSHTKEFIDLNSEKIANKILSSDLYKNSKTIMGFLAFGNEVNIDEVLIQALKDGKKVCVPEILNKTDLAAIQLLDMNNLVIGKYNIRSVNPNQQINIDPQTIDLVIASGLGFDATGNRIGLGAGYYDRFIAKAQKGTILGVAFSNHVISEVPVEETDMSMDYLVTEKELFKCFR